MSRPINPELRRFFNCLHSVPPLPKEAVDIIADTSINWEPKSPNRFVSGGFVRDYQLSMDDVYAWSSEGILESNDSELFDDEDVEYLKAMGITV